MKHNIVHHIVTWGPLTFCKLRHLAPKKRQIAKKEFCYLIKLGFVRLSNSEWSSPIHLGAEEKAKIIENSG